MSTPVPGTDVTFAASSLQDRMQWAKAIAGAGNLVPAGFRDGPNANPAKILLAVEYGLMLGLSPMAALSGIHVLDGKPTLSAALMSALVHKAGHKLRITTTGTVETQGRELGGDFTVTATLVRADDARHPFVAIWTIDRAKRAGLWGRGNWVKYPETQMTWRSISEVAKLGAPEVLLGVWHTPDELGADVDQDGDVIDDAEIVETETGSPSSNVGESRRANETEVNTRSDRQHTPGPGRVTSPSGTVDLSGAGRDNPPAPPTPATKSAASWVRDIQAAQTVEALTELYQMAVRDDALELKGRDGHTVDEWGRRRFDELKQAAAGEPDAVDPEYADIPEEVLY